MHACPLDYHGYFEMGSSVARFNVESICYYKQM